MEKRKTVDWPLAITRNSDALKRIVAVLFALVGARSGTTLPCHVYCAVMQVLRPAESAVRRLITIAAHALVLKPRASHPMPSGLPAFPATDALRTPAFVLFDPLKRFTMADFDHSADAALCADFPGLFDESHSAPNLLCSRCARGCAPYCPALARPALRPL